MYSQTSIDKSCVFRQTFGSVPEALSKKLTVTGTLVVENGEYKTLSQNQKLTYTDPNIGNFGTGPFSARIITKINSFTNIGSAHNSLISKNEGGNNGFGIAIESMSGNNLLIFAGTDTNRFTFTFDPLKYYDIIFTRSGTTIRLYIDGVFISSNTTTNNGLTVSSDKFRISGDITVFRYIKQSVKLVELYNKALSENEVQAISNNSKFKNYNPIMDLSKWIKGTGTYIEKYNTTGTEIISLGQKYFESTVVGTIFYPIQQAYGTWEWSMYSVETPLFYIITQNRSLISDGYFVQVRTSSIGDVRFGVNGGAILLGSPSSYVVGNTWYRYRLTRTKTGVFALYIKGGSFGNNFTLVSVSGGSGTNPVTNNTYITNNFICFRTLTTIGDRISDIRFYPYIV